MLHCMSAYNQYSVDEDCVCVNVSTQTCGRGWKGMRSQKILEEMAFGWNLPMRVDW